jgi:hypothetical protein
MPVPFIKLIMANDHKATVLTDKTFRSLFTEEERLNLFPLEFKGGNPKRKSCWDLKPGTDDIIQVYTESHGIIICRKINPEKGPFYGRG